MSEVEYIESDRMGRLSLVNQFYIAGASEYQNTVFMLIVCWIKLIFLLRNIWNHHSNAEARTNNIAESFHSKLNRLAGRPHLNIFSLICVMQTIQRETEIEIASLRNGEPARRRPLKYRKLDAKIIRLKELLSTSQITLRDYMDSISNVFRLED